MSDDPVISIKKSTWDNTQYQLSSLSRDVQELRTSNADLRGELDALKDTVETLKPAVRQPSVFPLRKVLTW